MHLLAVCLPVDFVTWLKLRGISSGWLMGRAYALRRIRRNHLDLFWKGSVWRRKGHARKRYEKLKQIPNPSTSALDLATYLINNGIGNQSVREMSNSAPLDADAPLLIIIICTMIAPRSLNHGPGPIVLGAAQTQNKDSFFHKDLTICNMCSCLLASMLVALLSWQSMAGHSAAGPNTPFYVCSWSVLCSLHGAQDHG